MPKIAKELSALQVSRLKTPGHHSVGGVTGLYLYVTETGSRAWVLRIVVGTKRRHMGLGAFPTVPLAQAREKARLARQAIENGQDPIDSRKQMASQLLAQQVSAISFEESAQAYIKAHADTWKNPKHRAQWQSTLQTYAYPHIGRLQVKDVEQLHILQVLEPIWRTKNETASRLRGRIESILDWATVRQYRTGENPAQWKGRLDKLLPAPGKIQKVQHMRALPYLEMPAFMQQLQEKNGTAAQALILAILCASRSGEVRGASWDEFDLDKAIWIIPAERMKAKQEHRVPLSKQALALIHSLLPAQHPHLLFPAPKGSMLSDMTITAVLRRMQVDAVPHGFRSTFRDWAGETTHHPREVIEQALAHTLTNKVEAAYRRGDALDKRRVLMQDWADFCGVKFF